MDQTEETTIINHDQTDCFKEIDGSLKGSHRPYEIRRFENVKCVTPTSLQPNTDSKAFAPIDLNKVVENLVKIVNNKHFCSVCNLRFTEKPKLQLHIRYYHPQMELSTNFENLTCNVGE
ncbi:hypothetical protein CHUAL_001782 [Chamberlinius hualienensis]